LRLKTPPYYAAGTPWETSKTNKNDGYSLDDCGTMDTDRVSAVASFKKMVLREISGIGLPKAAGRLLSFRVWSFQLFSGAFRVALP
jgi:hypothetical protein